MTDSKENPVRAEPPAPGALTRGHGALRVVGQVALLAGCFAVALIPSWIYREQSRCGEPPDTETTEAQQHPVHQIEKRNSLPADALECLTSGDEALERHQYARALSYYQELLAVASAAVPLVDYRVALCRESLGQAEQAIAQYRKVISAAVSPTLTWAGHLGMARCLLASQQPEQVRRVLYPFLLDESRQESVPAGFVADAHYLVALAMARQHLLESSVNPFEDTPVSSASTALEIPLYLEEASFAEKPRVKPVVDKPAAPLVVRKGVGRQPPLVTHVDKTCQPAWEMFELLAKESGLRIDVSEGAKKELGEQTLCLRLQKWTLPEVLTHAAAALGLLCSMDPDGAQITTAAEVDAGRLASVRRAMTLQVIRDAVQVEDTHEWTPAALLELGNGEALQGKRVDAVSVFERLVRDFPNSAHAVGAAYNQARIHALDHDDARARYMFLRVIDQAPGHELALRAQIRIGQSLLEQDNAAQAVLHLRRAMRVAPQSPYYAVATVTLAAAYLRGEQFEQAQQLLAKERTALQKEPFKSTGVFLDAYSQFQLAKAGSASRRQASELLSALWHEENGALLGPVGQILAAKAWAELGFCEQAERVLRQALAKTEGPVTTSLEFDLANVLLMDKKTEDATSLLEKAAAGSSPYRTLALLQLAKLDLESKRFTQCASRCQVLWNEQGEVDRQVVLQVWGAALEGVGDYAKAAQCFAGKAPL